MSGDSLHALVNSDYELELFKEELGTASQATVLRDRDRFEFIFFFINQARDLGLHSRRRYSERYLEYLTDLGLSVPRIARTADSFNWYGKLTDLQKEKRLNSKLWGYELLSKLSLSPSDYYIVQNRTEILEVLKAAPQQKWILKSPYLMSGANIHVFETNGAVPEIGHAHLLEPFFQRLMDLALFHSPFSGETFFYLNEVGPFGQYLGGTVFSEHTDLEDHLRQRALLTAFKDLEAGSLELLRHVQAEALEQTVSIDSFIFRSGEETRVHPGCDFNYRHNMGGLLNQLKRFLGPGGVGSFVLIDNDPRIAHFEFLPYSRASKTGVIYLSPPESDLLGLFFCAKNIDELARLKRFFFTTA